MLNTIIQKLNGLLCKLYSSLVLDDYDEDDKEKLFKKAKGMEKLL